MGLWFALGAAGEDSVRLLVRALDARGQQHQELMARIDAAEGDANGVWRELFHRSAEVLPAARRALAHPESAELAGTVMAFFGESRDLDAVIGHWEKSGPSQSDVPDSLISCLYDPDSERQWQFLRKVALDQARGVTSAREAIETLRFNGSARSRKILAEAAVRNPAAAKQAKAALEEIASNPTLPENADPAEAMRLILAKVGNVKDREDLAFDPSGNRAHFNFTVLSGHCRLTYSATLRRRAGTWRLTSSLMIQQVLLPPPPPSLQ